MMSGKTLNASEGIINDTLLLKTMEYSVGGITIGSITLESKNTHPLPFIVKAFCGFANTL